MDPNKALTQYRLDVWNVERGFPQNSVYTIAQTADGYIWLGTMDGLVRFDGARFHVFNKSNTDRLNDNHIRSLHVDIIGNLWIGTMNGGLSCFRDSVFTAYTPVEVPALAQISCIMGDQRGGLWIGSSKRGLTRLKNGKFTTFTTKQGLVSDHVSAICEDAKGNIWVAAENGGLTKRTPEGTFIPYTEKDGLSSNYIVSLGRGETQELWIGTLNGLNRLKDNIFTYYGVGQGLPNPKIASLYSDRSRIYWIGTDGGGLARMRDGKFDTFSSADGMVCNFVYSFWEDREGSLWIGTLEGGLHRLRDTKFTNFTGKEGLLDDYVNCIYEDRSGDFWIGTKGGLNRLRVKDGELSAAFTTDNGLLSNNVYSVLEDRDGVLWIGTDAGLHRYKEGKPVPFTTQDGLSHNRIYRLWEDKKGNLWIAAPNGLNRFHNGRFSTYSRKGGPGNLNIKSLREDHRGNLWIGTVDGLFRLKDGKFDTFTTGDGLPDNFVECIYEDKKGVLYIGTYGGLSRMVDETFVNFTVQDGLISNQVSYILEDEKENLWLSSPMGISCVRKKELEDAVRGKGKKILPVVYNEQDGMKTRWCKNNGLKSSSGELWFCTDKGVAMIDPADIKTNAQPPPVIIEEIYFNGQPAFLNHGGTDKPKTAIIPPGTKRVEFRYTALSFLNPQKIEFKIKLAGYDRDWIDMGNSRSTTYTSLSPGHYTFKVIACNSDGVWNNTGDSYSFYQEPYFYQTAWFYIIVALFFVVTIFAGYRIRMRQLIAQEKKLSALVDLRTKALNERTLELEKSKQIIEEKNQSILSSIRYARTIQQAILPPDDRMEAFVKDYFILFKPRDIVSGDFYWFNSGGIGDKYFIAAVDCTGHGVPGAFLSMIGNMRLNDLVKEKRMTNPALLLSHLHIGVRDALQQEDEDLHSHDGMEVALCMLDLPAGKIVFSGAKRPLFYIKKPGFVEIKGDRKPIGGHQKENNRSFTNHEIDIDTETVVYLTTDGFVDQNNSDNKKYGSRRLKQFLRDHAHLGMVQQKEALLEELKIHQGTQEQRDDITIIGIKLDRPRG